MKIYTQDDKPVKRTHKFFSKDVLMRNGNNYDYVYYDYFLKQWFSKTDGEPIDSNLEFQWVYPDEVFKQEKV